jgi:L-proline amide hydrolase
VESLILANSAASTERWVAEANLLRAKRPQDVQQTLKQHEEAGTTDDPAYATATDVYYRRHLCRLHPRPDCFIRTLEKLAQDPEVYNTMWGPSEFHCTGKLQNWDIESQLGEIDVPTLILSGEYDESTPAINEVLHRGIQNSEWVLFEKSSHTPHLEVTQKYLQVLRKFLNRVEVTQR